MRFNLKYAFVFASVLSAQQAFTNEGPIEKRPLFFTTAQFLDVCDASAETYSDFVSLAEKKMWSKVSDAGVVSKFFENKADFENLSVFEYSSLELGRMNEDFLLDEAYFLAVAEYNFKGRVGLMCQIRSYSGSAGDLLIEDFEKSTVLVASRNLARETISTNPDFQKYVYYPETQNSFYNVWDRRLDNGEFVFALSKTLILTP